MAPDTPGAPCALLFGRFSLASSGPGLPVNQHARSGSLNIAHNKGCMRCLRQGNGRSALCFMSGTNDTITPYLWRSPFPLKVTRQLVSTANPTGRVNNSDLELAGSVAQHDILCQIVDVQDVTIHNCYDNTSTVFWKHKGSATTTGPAAYLLRLQAPHQCHYGYAPLHGYIPGEVNLMADVAS
jgi:hypothetical protein